MLRGRHRGLPVAIDRAVLLPSEYAKEKQSEDDERNEGNNEFPDMTPAGADAGPSDTQYPDEKQEPNGSTNDESELKQRRTKI